MSEADWKLPETAGYRIAMSGPAGAGPHKRSTPGSRRAERHTRQPLSHLAASIRSASSITRSSCASSFTPGMFTLMSPATSSCSETLS